MASTEKSFNKNIDLKKKIFSLIWLRKSVVFNIRALHPVDKYLNEIISFIPDYRQLVFFGRVPRSLTYMKCRSKILKLSDAEIIDDSIYHCFDEESIHTPPLQIVHFDANKRVIIELISKIGRGWIAFVNDSANFYKNLAQKQQFVVVDAKKKEIVFSNGDWIPSAESVEHELFSKVGDCSGEAFKVLLQKKVNELRYVGQALIREIEAGKKLEQKTIQDLFEIDSVHFYKVIELLKVESGVDISSYIIFNSDRDSRSI